MQSRADSQPNDPRIVSSGPVDGYHPPTSDSGARSFLDWYQIGTFRPPGGGGKLRTVPRFRLWPDCPRAILVASEAAGPGIGERLPNVNFERLTA